MSTPFEEPRLSPWEEEGRRQAAMLDRCSFVVVVGDDPSAAAELALGMARAHARRRRVAVADAVGELPPIEDLAPIDAPYGIVDVFVHGVSLSRAAQSVDPSGNLNVLPSGPMPLDRTAVLRSPRWGRIAAEFRDAGALLLLIAPADEPAVETVLPLADGVVLVGRAPPFAGARVLLAVQAPGLSGSPAPRPRATPSVPTGRVTPIERGAPAARLTTARPERPAPRRRWPVWVAAGLAVIIAAGALWRVTRSRPIASTPARTTTRLDSAASSDAAPAVDLAARAAAAAADSEVRSSAYAVELAVLTSATGANVRLEWNMFRDLPALTYAPVADSSGERGFRLLAGAYRDRSAAESLLAALRARAVLRASEGRVLRAPFALVMQSGVTRDEASFYITGFRAKGLPVYSLVQDDGQLRLYAGAFERAADAALLVAAARANGESPSVTYRTGRSP